MGVAILPCLLLAWGVSEVAFGQEGPGYGPSSGALVIVGGGQNSAF
jgi:hypothetical protein